MRRLAWDSIHGLWSWMGTTLARKLLLAALAAVTLAGCGSMGCGGAANNNASGGSCGTHITFLH